MSPIAQVGVAEGVNGFVAVQIGQCSQHRRNIGGIHVTIAIEIARRHAAVGHRQHAARVELRCVPGQRASQSRKFQRPQTVPLSVPQSRMSNVLPAAGAKALSSEICNMPPSDSCPVTWS